MLTDSRHIDKSLTVAKYYGKDRNADLKPYFTSDFVFTTYHTIASSINQTNAAVFNIEWFRVVLDEGKCDRPVDKPPKMPSNV